MSIIKSQENSKYRIDWPMIMFFVIAYAIAWGLILYFNVVAKSSGVESGLTLMSMTESLELEPIAATLPVPEWFLYLLTRIQDFAFTISGILVTALVAGKAGFAVLKNKFCPSLASWKWYAAALLLPYGIFGLAVAIAIAGDNTILETASFSFATVWSVLFSANAGIVFYMLLRGGMGEELGLRGFALSRLQVRNSPIVASLIIGVLWAGWHIPVYLQSDIVSVIASFLLAFTFSFLFTFFYNYAKESLWVVILLHAGINAGDNAFEIIFPGLSVLDWQIPAYIGMLLVSIVLSFVLWKGHKKDELSITSVYY
ncbi:MAG: CPBP family intramembrane metalloprotease [Anaerolineae bacterium]|jgi:uncharacterized protein|nr:CPBP family intramembrane metalloprotease [Anaerolineae bacterium]MBT7075013.1 CPBP family intramembrane metalloprotease [Anaerolineae bacterium]MBT7782946.1 CPBP family intramembrane metalloprotease [Anaerolineae bacterium]